MLTITVFRQRAHWIQIASQYPNVEAQAIEFDMPYDVCKSRLLKRTDHETLTDPQQSVKVLNCFSSSYVAPTLSEGFTKILSLKYTRDGSNTGSLPLSKAFIIHTLARLDSSSASRLQHACQASTFASEMHKSDSIR